ncbi:hypothetical protein [Paenibacillus sp. Y412MC10]|uniref:hypothetical protein n=1 Tax=Geobacillus sp. (strain Y412MC10) TaxID=481743 RepID=UPI0011A4DD07|nr:hypothetical protein [Paenibacillus sp. Y412MC10]
MGFTKGSWSVFKPLLEAKHQSSTFHLVEDGEIVIIAEIYHEQTFVHRINRETGDLHTLNNRCSWMWEDNVWDQAPVKMIPAWSIYKDGSYLNVFDNRDAALICQSEIGGAVTEGFSTDHPIPNVGQYYVEKEDLLDDLQAEGITLDLITDETIHAEEAM